ncbi:MAG TPA: cell surface protein SprA, partial [Dysgonomonas sp.]|nr:cell surface protein SprA [Dysgonomonas sp.]
LGEISEDVLKDGYKFYENGLPTDESETDTKSTVWGRVPTRQSTVYAFDNSLSEEARRMQDAGLNGLTTEQEFGFETYQNYLSNLRRILTPEVINRWDNDPHSPLRDPAGDNYRHYRGDDLDNNEVSILDRYKYYNGTEGNSFTDNSNNQTYTSAANSLPDVEDLNQDYTMNETESYYEYKVPLKPNMNIGDNNFIVDKREVKVNLVNGDTNVPVTWYQFRIPIREGTPQGNIRDFRSIRFMRMYLTGFEEEAFLRFGTLDLIRSEWRTYTQQLEDGINEGQGTINVSAVNIEENSQKKPVSYVVPPGVSRIPDPNQAQIREENEQAMSLQVNNLDPKDARAIYKNTNYDLRRYKRLQMFTHAEELIDGPELERGEMTVFMRLGSDYKNNYYEYEIPLSITPPREYSSRSNSDQLAVWPQENMFDFPLELLTNLKLERNREKRKAGSEVSYTQLYSAYDPDKPNNKVSIIGNPSLSEISVMMIGVRNNTNTKKSAEIWVNELRMTDYDEEGGWAAQANLNVGLSDIATINLSGRKETAGFGAIDQNMMQRRNDDFSSYTVSTNVDIGRLIPEQVKLSAPLFYSYSNQTITPKYDPLDQDIKIDDALDAVETKAEKDSIKNLSQDKTITKNFSLTNVRLNINSKNPMPYDPANFTFGYAFSKTEISNPTTAYDRTENYKASLNYSYSPLIKPWEPFKNIQSNAGWTKYPKSLSFNYLPNNIAFNSYITRYYTETLTRDLESFIVGGDNSKNQILTFSQNFYWDRDFSINWDFMPNLKFSMQTGTRAEIEEPYLQVNKKLNPDDYEIWKDSVMRSIKNLGTPLSYRQTAQLTYTLPTQNIPVLDWINSSANYSSEYTWDRGDDIEIVEDGKKLSFEVGNTVTNYMSLNLTNQFNMVNLYNKFSFLKKVNEKFDSQRNRRQQRQPRQRTKRFEQEVRLNTDSATIVSHGLGTRNIIVTARENGRIIKLKFKKVDENRIRINRKDTAQIRLNIVDTGEPDETVLYKIAQYGARGLMSVRSVSFNYSMRNETALAGFRPGVGDAFGQRRTNHGLVPGLGFAFGLEGGEDFFDRVRDNGWLILDGENINPAVYNSIRKFDIDVQLEPIKGLKIRLNGLHEKNNRTSYQYTTNNTITTAGGNFAMTTIALSSAFDSGNAKNGYQSNAFDKFISNIETIRNRVENIYSDRLKYPDRGFLAKTSYANQGYSTNNGSVDPYSSDVLI